MTGLEFAIAGILLLSTIAFAIFSLKRGAGAQALNVRLEVLEKASERLERGLRDDLKGLREETSHNARQDREERAASARELRDGVLNGLKGLQDSILKLMSELSSAQKLQIAELVEQHAKLIESNEKKLEGLRQTVEINIKALQADNAQQLDKMRATVDEKLQGTLEKRLGESFQQVSERLEQVYRGLGEMQSLAVGVGDLKRVLTNIKTRGGWGEIQLGSLLEQLLTPEQFDRNVKTKSDSNELVEFAIRLPGRGNNADEIVWLPVDSKFPTEDYERLVEAERAGDTEAADAAGRMLESQIKKCARDISSKYLNPPATTDFAVMFLPTEGLYAEVVRRNGVIEYIQQECRVVIAGPTTFAALLNALQMGFRTLAIEQRSSEVWNLLGAVKTEFGKFGTVLDKVKKNLEQASNTIESAAVRSRAIERKLRKVEELPSEQASLLLGEVEQFEEESAEGASLAVES